MAILLAVGIKIQWTPGSKK